MSQHESHPVDHPQHYNAGDIECIDALRACLTPDEFRGFLKGNVIKYLWRERHKKGAQDVAKAAYYQTWLVQFMADESSTDITNEAFHG